MIARLLAQILGTNNARQLKKLQPVVDQINALEPEIQQLSDDQLRAKTTELREELAKGKTLDDILPHAFAVAREAARRTLGQRPYDVQLVGGIALHQGKIAEMRTGEGKTLTATMPLYLNALAGKGVHLVTVNDYLARRDSEWMAPVYTALGLTVGCLQNNMNDIERKIAYNTDILYATNNELGFDYLRDNMKFRLEDYVQRDLHYAIVDEVDSILIDEARTPLIISGATDESSKLYERANDAVKNLRKDEDYEVDEKARTVQLTEQGNDKIEQFFGVDNLYAMDHVGLLHHVSQALRAHALFRKDVDYVIQNDEVLIVDEFTGRILPGRRYSDGLHQALEAKEHVNIERESQTLASITLQNYFRLYKKLAGMTGTALTDAEEFHKIYKLEVLVIPTNRPLIRTDKPDLIFLSEVGKYKAIVEDVKERYRIKQPVLIGTIAVEKSELLSKILTMNGIPHEVLNAKQHQREADIVAHAGEPGRITIATNMAGRGTDIKLTPESVGAGGLYILGTERHESRRIDNQLRGRSGRQGDPGESRFYISLDDDLIRIFSGDSLKKNMLRVGMQEDEVIESNLVSRSIENSQEKVEKRNFEYRKQVLEYDDVLNQQRIVIYGYRREVLEASENMHELVRDLIIKTIQDGFERLFPERAVTPEAITELYQRLAVLTGLPIKDFEAAGFSIKNCDDFERDGTNFILEKYDLYRKSGSEDHMQRLRQAEKWLLLNAIDNAWKQHMLNLDRLKEGIGLRGYGQKTPIYEYKREAFYMFKDMLEQIRYEVIHSIFHLKLDQFNEHEMEQQREHEMEQMHMISSGPDENVPQPVERTEEKIGRNDPCTCGSGKKYKKCCG